MDLFSSFFVVAATRSATDAKASTNGTSDYQRDTPQFIEVRSLRDIGRIMRGPHRDAAAFVISALTSPFLVCAVAAGALAMRLAPAWGATLLWGIFTSLFAGVLPFLLVSWLCHCGQVADLHVANRRQRWIPLGASVLSGLFGLLALWLFGAPPKLYALTVAYVANAAVFTLISFVWKASVHAGVYAGAFTACALVVGPSWWTGLAGIPLVVWARARRGRHTICQGVVGAVVALVTTVIAYRLTVIWWNM
ncbi:MAG: hypothetical protein ACUVX8_02150 [Candidatus Zipacnadales bacterium]